MRFFKLEPGGGLTEDGRAPVAELLERISADIEKLGGRKAVLLVEDDTGVTMAIGRTDGFDDSPKDTADMLLRVALDAKDVVG